MRFTDNLPAREPDPRRTSRGVSQRDRHSISLATPTMHLWNIWQRLLATLALRSGR
jgi:hypothetical protein